MKVYELQKFGFTEVNIHSLESSRCFQLTTFQASRSIPTITQSPEHTPSRQLLEREEAEDWSSAINALETRRLKQDVEDRFLNLTRKPIAPITGIKCKDNFEGRRSEMCEDDSDLEEGEIREFPRHLPKKIKFDPVLEVEQKIKQEPV